VAKAPKDSWDGVIPPKGIPGVPWNQSADGILLPEDMPEGWFLVTNRYAGERDYDVSDWIDIVLGYDGGWSPGQAERDTERREAMAADWRAGRWKYLEHTPTGTRVYVRVEVFTPGDDSVAAPRSDGAAAKEDGVEGEVRITGVVYLPRFPGGKVSSRPQQRFPLAHLEARLNKRLFGKTKPKQVDKRRLAIEVAAEHLAEKNGTLMVKGGDAGFTLVDGKKEKVIAREQVFTPLHIHPRREPLFYAWVALQYELIETAEAFTTTPTQKLAEVNDVPLSTAQGWVREARKRGLLPPVRPGQG
jgi:hypothetical protein